MDSETRRVIFRMVENQTQNVRLTYKGLVDFPMSLLEIQGMTHLDLSNNRLSELPESISLLRDLEYLNLANNNLISLPQESLAKLKKLRHVNLSGNQLLFFPSFILDIPTVQYLYLQKNEIVNIPKEIKDLKQLKILYIGDNNISNIPLEIVETSKNKNAISALSNYFYALEDGEDELYEAKLILVGSGAVGKTSLANKIIDSSYKLEDQETTRGIDILKWSFELNDESEKKFSVNIWDFGGQQIYYKTHQFFLTKRSFYVLVWDARSEENYHKSFRYWLSVIKLLSNSSPVVIVQNKIDERMEEIEQKQFKNSFPNITNFYKVSCDSNLGIDVLKEHISTRMQELPHVGDLLPIVWIEIRKSLERIKENHISRRRYLEICSSYTLDKTKADLLGDYLHDLGTILHFSDDPLLKEIVILRPEWATQAVYLLIDNHDSIENNGKLTYKEIETIWVNNGYEDRHEELLRLMEKFEMCFRFSENGKFKYVIPQLLNPDVPDQFIWPRGDEMYMEYKYVFMPHGIFTRLMVKLHQYLDENENIWRNGAVIVKDNHQTRAFLENKPLEDKIVVRIIGKDKAGILVLIRMALNEIHQSLNLPEYSEMCGCVCHECETTDRTLFDLKKLEKAKNKGKHSVECQVSWSQVEIDKLMFGIDSSNLFYSDIQNKDKEAVKNESEDLSEYYLRMHNLISSFIRSNNSNKRDVQFLQSQLDIVTEELASRDERKDALNVIYSFYNQSVHDISSSVIGAAIIELGKLIISSTH